MEVSDMFAQLELGEKVDLEKIGERVDVGQTHVPLDASQLVLFDKDAPDPRQYGVPHEFYRVGQWQTCEFVRDETTPSTVVEQPTGSGKSAVAKTLSNKLFWETDEHVRAVVLTRTKALQDQYGGEYNAYLMKGKSNYSCVHPKAKRDHRADECLFADRGMHKCEKAQECPYLIAKHDALTKPFVCTNYAYWLSAFLLKKEMFDATMKGQTRSLICDEAHLLSDMTLDWSGTTIHHFDRIRYELPSFPKIRRHTGKSTMSQLFDLDEDTRSSLDIAHDWLLDSRAIVEIEVKRLMKKAPFDDDDGARREAMAAERFLNKLENTASAIEHSRDDWFIRSGTGVVYHRGKDIPGIVIKPLTARHQFPRLFIGSTRTLLMSATIGDPKTFSEELGLDDFKFRAVPNQFPPESRRVHVLDAPRMGYKSKAKDYDRQADVIAEAILGLDPTWSGIIHVTKKKAAQELADRLARRGLGDRVWVPPIKQGRFYLSTTEQLEAWEQRKAWKPNSLLVGWQFKEGFDGRKERICISAKTPFPYLGDEYESARQKYSGAFYLWRTACDLMQSLGRTRRGRVEDYDFATLQGYVAIADMNYKRVQKYLSQDIKESLVFD